LAADSKAAVDNVRRRDRFPAMRAAVRTLAVCCLCLGTVAGPLAAGGCIPDENKEPKWRQPPKAWDPKGDTLTFGEKNLDAFNSMTSAEREAHLQALQSQAGSFKGQARFQRATELGDKMDDAALGNFEVYATVEDPVLFEITLEYHLFANEKIGGGFPPGAYIEFTGTLAEMSFQDESKPRKMEIKVKDVSLQRLDL
jgi:hypothetical protein